MDLPFDVEQHYLGFFCDELPVEIDKGRFNYDR